MDPVQIRAIPISDQRRVTCRRTQGSVNPSRQCISIEIATCSSSILPGLPAHKKAAFAGGLVVDIITVRSLKDRYKSIA